MDKPKTGQTNQPSIGDKLKVFMHNDIDAAKLHVLRRQRIPSKFYVSRVSSKKWEEWIAKIEQNIFN